MFFCGGLVEQWGRAIAQQAAGAELQQANPWAPLPPGPRRRQGAHRAQPSPGPRPAAPPQEGFTPATFRSSRSDRASAAAAAAAAEEGGDEPAVGGDGGARPAGGAAGGRQQDLDYFLDEDEKEERGRCALGLAPDYDTFGDAAAQAARARAAGEARGGGARPEIIPGGLIDELVAPVASGVGVRLLQKMGWRQGRGVGGAGGGGGGKWGAVAGVGVENTPIYVLEPKQDHHGLGYDPFREAEEFRAARAARRGGGGGGGAPGGSAGRGAGGGVGGAGAGAKRGRGMAFGVGVGDDDDVCAVEFEDYIDDEAASMGAKGARRQDVFAFEDASESGGWPLPACGTRSWSAGRLPWGGAL
jgi:G patch domain-containing protein 1